MWLKLGQIEVHRIMTCAWRSSMRDSGSCFGRERNDFSLSTSTQTQQNIKQHLTLEITQEQIHTFKGSQKNPRGGAYLSKQK